MWHVYISILVHTLLTASSAVTISSPFVKKDSFASGCTSYVQRMIQVSGTKMAVACQDSSVRFCDTSTLTCTSPFANGHTQGVFGLALASKDGNYLISASLDKSLIVWNMAGVKVKTLSGHTDVAWDVVMLPDGKIASGGKDSFIRVWGLPSSTSTAPLFSLAIPGQEIRALCVSYDKVYLIASFGASLSGSKHGLNMYAIASLSSTSPVFKTNFMHGDFIRSIVSLPNGNIISCSLDHYCMVWTSVLTLSWAMGYFGAGFTASSSVYMDGGSYLISGASDSYIYAWDSSVVNNPTALYGIAASLPVYSLALIDSLTLASSGSCNTNSCPIDIWSRPCAEPSTTQYVTAPCASFLVGTSITACSTPITGSFVTALCTRGSSTTKGSDLRSQVCSTTGPMAGIQFVSRLCYVGARASDGSYTAVGSDLTFASCQPPSSAEWTQSICIAGDFRTLGSGSVVQACSNPTTSHFVTSKCVSGSTTVIGTDTALRSCTSPPKGSYTVSPCSNGKYNSLGTDTVTNVCYTPVNGVEYILATCVEGNANAAGSNTVSRACSVPTIQQYTTVKCRTTTAIGVGIDTVITSCTTPLDRQYTSIACRSGSPTILGEDTVVSDCSTPPPGSYVLRQCQSGTVSSPGNDTLLDVCSIDEPTTAHYIFNLCLTGTTSLAGKNQMILACSVPTSYQFTVSVCIPGNSRGSMVGRNTVISECTNPSKGSFTVSLCRSGSWDVPGADTETQVCTDPTTPPPGYYVSSLCTSGGSYNKFGTDFGISPCTKPKAGQFVYKACEAGDSNTLGSDTGLCVQGYYCSGTGLSTICPLGNYCSEGATVPTPCTTVGSYCPMGSMSENLCSPGSRCPSPSVSLPCEAGTFSTGGNITCTQCPSGFYCPRAASSPTLCAPGKWSDSGSGYVEQCTDCEAGYACTGGVKRVCDPGTYSGAGQSFCAVCQPGNSCSSIGGQSPCQAGSYNEGGESLSCRKCLKGKYCPLASTIEQDCPAGFYCRDPSVKEECTRPGSYCPPSSIVEGDCLPGNYCPNSRTSLPCRSPQLCLARSVTPASCIPGYYCPNPDTIYPCSAPKYCPSNSTSMHECPFPMETTQNLMSSSTDCVCLPGLYFDDTANEADPQCLPCPVGFQCRDVNTTLASMVTTDGFYRVSPGSLTIVPCPDETCLNSTCNAERGISNSFFCSRCLPSYYRSSSLQGEVQCDKCEDNMNPVWEFTLFILGGSLIMAFLIMAKMKKIELIMSKTSSFQKKQPSLKVGTSSLVTKAASFSTQDAPSSRSNTSVIQRLALSHFQVISLLGRFKLIWPSELIQMFKVSDSVSSGVVSSIGGGVKCLLISTGIPLPFQDLIITIVLYCIGITLISIFWSVVYVIGFIKQQVDQRASQQNVKEKVIISFIVLSFIMYSTFVRSFFQCFACLIFPGDDRRRLQGDLDVLCYEGIHLKYLQTLALPVGLFIVLGFPAIAYLILRKKKRADTLYDEETMRLYSFLYDGYKPDFWYFEFVILARKVALSFVSVFLSSVTISIAATSYQQGLAALGIFIFSMEIQAYQKPYNNDELNRLESIGLRVASITMFLSLMTFADIGDSVGQNRIFQTSITVTLLAVNGFYSLYLFKHILAGYFIQALAFISKRICKLSHFANEDNILEIPLEERQRSSPSTSSPTTSWTEMRPSRGSTTSRRKEETFVKNPLL